MYTRPSNEIIERARELEDSRNQRWQTLPDSEKNMIMLGAMQVVGARLMPIFVIPVSFS